MIYILYSSQSRCFATMADNIKFILERNCIPVKVCVDEVTEETPEDTCIIFSENINVFPKCKCINFDEISQTPVHTNREFEDDILTFFVQPVNYVIATYSGRCYSRIRDPISPLALEYQLQELLQIIKTKYEQRLINNVQKITIVKPKCKPEHFPPFEGYYGDTEKWVSDFAEYGIEVEYLEYTGNNEHHSYDQWIQGMLTSDCKYNVVIEDDYCVCDPLFDQELINEYQTAFKDDIGYLCSWINSHPEHQYPIHAAISNGIISKKTISTFDNMLQEFYNLPRGQPQLNFSTLFLKKGIQIKDIAERYISPFWDSSVSNIKIFTTPVKPPYTSIFIPVQQVKTEMLS
jgi:hypothetical protein